MYGKVFSSMYDGTLATKGPWQALVTFQQMIVLADKDGVVDMTAGAISRRTSIPLEIIETGIRELSEPDEESRSPDEDGRRIVLLEGHRTWGWQIVNYAKYAALRSAEERREYMRVAQAEHRAKVKAAAEQASKHVKKRHDDSAVVKKSTDVPVPVPVPVPVKEGEDGCEPRSFIPALNVDVDGHKPTSAGLLCRAIKAAGVADVNPGHPDLLRLMAGQIPEETWTATAAELAGKGRGKFALLMKTVEGRWNDAQTAGPVAAAVVADPWETRAGVDSIAKQLGIHPWDECCEFRVFKARVRAEFDRKNGVKAA